MGGKVVDDPELFDDPEYIKAQYRTCIDEAMKADNYRDRNSWTRLASEWRQRLIDVGKAEYQGGDE